MEQMVSDYLVDKGIAWFVAISVANRGVARKGDANKCLDHQGFSSYSLYEDRIRAVERYFKLGLRISYVNSPVGIPNQERIERLVSALPEVSGFVSKLKRQEHRNIRCSKAIRLLITSSTITVLLPR